MRRARSADSLNDWISRLYTQIRLRARRMLGNQSLNHMLQANGLVNELYIRLRGTDPASFDDDDHFLRYASVVMRNILRDHARSSTTMRRGKGCIVSLSDLDPDPSMPRSDVRFELIDVVDALHTLETVNASAAAVMHMTYFLQLRAHEVAALLGCAERTVVRHLEFGRSWLSGKLRRGGPSQAAFATN